MGLPICFKDSTHEVSLIIEASTRNIYNKKLDDAVSCKV